MYTYIQFPKDMHWGILKIAIGFYLHKDHDVNHIKDKVEILKGINDGKQLTPLKCVVLYTPQEILNINYIQHTIIIQGCSSKNCIYGFVSLFGVGNYFILLSDSYTGEDFKEEYTYNLSSGTQMDVPININLCTIDANQLLQSNPNPHVLDRSMGNFMRFFVPNDITAENMSKLFCDLISDLNIPFNAIESNRDILFAAFNEKIENHSMYRYYPQDLKTQIFNFMVKLVCHFLKEE